jgi:hypothetical protein
MPIRGITRQGRLWTGSLFRFDRFSNHFSHVVKMTYLLIVLMFSGGSSGFSVEFNSKEACEEALLGVQRSLYSVNALCVAKGTPQTEAGPRREIQAPEPPAKAKVVRKQAPALLPRAAGRYRTTERPRCIWGYNCDER